MESQHACELCGKILSDDALLLEHTKTHIEEENQECPFCGLSSNSNELVIHVNQHHLDFLTPTSPQNKTNLGLHYIDDQTPSSYYSMDSDSMSDFRLSSPESNHKVKMNGYSYSNGGSTSGAYSNGDMATSSGGVVKKDYNNRNGVMTNGGGGGSSNGSETPKELFNNSEASKGKQGSPLRNQLGLKLKVNKPVSSQPSPICPLCPYSSNDPSVLQEHINRAHFDPLSPGPTSSSHKVDTLTAFACPICNKAFETASAVELHVNIEHKDILSPAKIDDHNSAAAAAVIHDQNGASGFSEVSCPVCGLSFTKMKTSEMEVHIENHFTKSPQANSAEVEAEKLAQKLREQREFEILRAQYGMDCQGNFREQSTNAMQRAVYAGEMSVADYYERQVGLKAAETHGVDDGLSCTRSVAARVSNLSAQSPGVIKSFVCSSVDHYASSYGDKGWGCGYRNLQMLLSSLLQNTLYNEAIYSAWGQHGPSRTAMPSISRLQRMVEAAWADGFDTQGADQLGKLYNTRKWIGATEIVTVLSWLHIDCQLVDFHHPTSSDGRHPDLFNWVLKYFEEPRIHTPPLYLQHQGECN